MAASEKTPQPEAKMFLGVFMVLGGLCLIFIPAGSLQNRGVIVNILAMVLFMLGFRHISRKLEISRDKHQKDAAAGDTQEPELASRTKKPIAWKMLFLVLFLWLGALACIFVPPVEPDNQNALSSIYLGITIIVMMGETFIRSALKEFRELRKENTPTPDKNE